MKARQPRVLLLAIFVFAALLLSACKVNFITEIKSDGSGTYTQELGFTKDEASMAGMGADTGSEEFCTNANAQSSGSELPPNTVVSQEQRGDGEIWCIFKSSFATLDDLRAVYSTTDMQINSLEIIDGKMIYDVSMDMSGEGADIPMGDIYWIVTMPGSVSDHNATEKKGNTLNWKLEMGKVNSMRAESSLSMLGGNTLYIALGSVAFLCLCCFVPLVLGGLAFFLLRRKKNTATAA